MGDSDESWSGGDSSSSSEDAVSSEAETSDTDEDVKYTTYPTRGVRWRIGGAGRPQGFEKIKDPKEKRKLWRQGEGIRPAEQRNIDEYVPGRLPYLKKWIKDSEVAEKGASFEPRPSTKAICQRCQTRIPYSANPKELMKHIEKCWAPGLEPPVGESDGREHRPNLLGEVAAEVDTSCQLFTIHSPGPYGGAYLLLVALPSQEGTLEKLDTLLRKVWFPDVDHNFGRPDLKHLSMFMMSQASGMDRTQLKMELQRLQLSVMGSDEDLRGRLEEHWFRQDGAKKDVQGDHWASVVQVNEVKGSGNVAKMEVEESVSLEDRLYSGFLPNCGALELAGMGPGVSTGLLTAGRVITVRVWTEEGPEVWWPAVCIPETSTGLLGKVDGERGRYRRYDEGALWHCVFINRDNKRFWVRPNYQNMMHNFPWRYPERGLTLETAAEVEDLVKIHTEKPAPNSAVGEHYLDFKDLEEREQWLEAFKEAVRLYYLESDQAVLKKCQELGMTGDGELVPTIGYQQQLDVECALTGRITQPIEEKEKAQWSFLKPQPDNQHPVPLPVRKEAGLSYWPLLGSLRHIDKSSLLIPDRTDQSTTSIFTRPGQTAFYHFDLAEGFTSRCRLTYQGDQVVRLKGSLDPTWVDQGRLERDPEWERDMKALSQGCNNFDPLSKFEESSKKIEFRLPTSGEPVVVARNEAPFVPCMQCGDKVSQWCQVRSSVGASSWASWEDPDLRLSQTIHLCSMPCGLAWSGGGDRDTKVEGKEQLGDYETDMMMHLGNSPRSGIPHYGYNTAALRLHVMHEGLLWNEYVRPWRIVLLPGFSMYKIGSAAGFGTWPSTQRPGWKRDVEYCEDERPRYRHHPLWPKQDRKRFRHEKHIWQDKILARVKYWGLEVPPVEERPTHDQLYFD